MKMDLQEACKTTLRQIEPETPITLQSLQEQKRRHKQHSSRILKTTLSLAAVLMMTTGVAFAENPELFQTMSGWFEDIPAEYFFQKPVEGDTKLRWTTKDENGEISYGSADYRWVLPSEDGTSVTFVETGEVMSMEEFQKWIVETEAVYYRNDPKNGGHRLHEHGHRFDIDPYMQQASHEENLYFVTHGNMTLYWTISPAENNEGYHFDYQFEPEEGIEYIKANEV